MRSREARIRKQQSILMCSGLAVILFGVWSIIRIVLLRFADKNHFIHLLDPTGIVQEHNLLNVVLVGILIILSIDLIIRTYIGISAMQEGLGKMKKRITYIVVAAICLAIALYTDITSTALPMNDDFSFEFFLSTVIDISAHIATFEIIVASIKLRKLMKEQQ